MNRCPVLIWMFLYLSTTVLGYTDFSIHLCQSKSGSPLYYGVGLWHKTISKLEPNALCQDDLPCGPEYAPIDHDSIDHIHLDMMPCSNATCSSMSPQQSSYPGHTYTVEIYERSAIINLHSMKAISRITVMFNETSSNVTYTISLSNDGWNWNPAMHDGKVLSMTINPYKLNSCVTKKLVGKFVKITFNTDSALFRLNASIDVFVSGSPGTNTSHIASTKPSTLHFQGCYAINDYMYGENHTLSGLPMNQAVNLDQCLKRCALLQGYMSAFVINSVTCVCNKLNAKNFNSPFPLSSCNSLSGNTRIGSVYTVFQRLKPTVIIPEKINLTDVFVIRVTSNSTNQGKVTIAYNLGDGYFGETCSGGVSYRYKYTGIFNVTVHVSNHFNDYSMISSPLTVEDIPQKYRLTCPSHAPLGLNMTCHVTMTRGSNMSLMVDYDHEILTHRLPDVNYYELGEDPHSNTIDTATPIEGGLVFGGYPITADGELLGVEFNLAKAGGMRFMIIRKEQTTHSTQCPTSTTNKIECPSAHLFSLYNGTCTSSMNELDLSDYKYVHDIVISRHLPKGYQYIPLGVNFSGIFVKKGDVIVMDQTELTGTVATLNESSDFRTISIYPSIKDAVIDEPFKFNASQPKTKLKLAVQFLLSELINHHLVYSFSNPGSKEIKSNMIGNHAENVEYEVKVKVIERINKVNITIPGTSLLGTPTNVQIQASGAPWQGRIDFGSEKILQFSDNQPGTTHTLQTRQVYNVSIVLRNEVSVWSRHFQIETVRQVGIPEVNYCWKGIVHNTSVFIEALFSQGDSMNASITLNGSLVKQELGITTDYPKPYSLNRTLSFPVLGAFNLTVFGENALSNATVECLVFVEIPIEEFNITGPKPKAIRTDYTTNFTFAIGKGSNATYSVELNDTSIPYNCSNVQCSEAYVIFPRTLEAGNYVLEVCVWNKVTPKTCDSHQFDAVDPIMKMRFNYCKPKCINAVGKTFQAFLSIKKGTGVTYDWWIEGYPRHKGPLKAGIHLLRELTCHKPVVAQMIANCTNNLGSVVMYSNFTCMHPVKDLILKSDSPQVVMNGIINFTLSMPPGYQSPTNASCLIEFGDQEKHHLEDCVLPMNFSHRYFTEGDFLVKVNVTNKLSSEVLNTTAKIQKPIEVIILKIERSKCDPMFGRLPGGKSHNMVPLECPFHLKIVRMDGSRPNLRWRPGNGTEILTSNKVMIMQHSCEKEGEYNFTLEAFNDVSSLSSFLIYECRPSIECRIHENSPYLTKRPVQMTVEVINHDFLTTVEVTFGDGKSVVLGTNEMQKDFPGNNYKLVSPFTGNISVVHTFVNRGELQVSCNAANSVSRHVEPSKAIFVLHKPCRKPVVKIDGVSESANKSSTRNETRKETVIIFTQNIIDCEASRATIFQWNVSQYHGPGNFSRLYHPSWKVNTSKLIITNGTLPLGTIRVDFALRMVHEITGNVMGASTGFFDVLPSDLEVIIDGGHSRSEETTVERIVYANLFDPDAELGDVQNDVEWVWLTKSGYVSSSYSTGISAKETDNCFGYTFGKLPFVHSWFRYDATNIPPNTKCFLKAVASRGDRIAIFEQQVEFLEGPLPNLKISCKVNCDHFNPSGIISFEGHVDNFNMSDLYMEWSVVSEGADMDITDKTLTGTSHGSFAFKSGALEGGKLYEIIFRAWVRGKKHSKGYVSMKFATNRSPRDGQCSISPESGSAVITPFFIDCYGWIDEDLLVYKVILKSTVDQFLFTGRLLDRPFFLPYAESGEVNIEVMILDIRGAYNISRLKAKVESSDEVLMGITAALESNGPLLNNILGGDTQMASQMLISVASVVLSSHHEAGNDTGALEVITKQIAMFVDIAHDLPCDTPDDVLSISTTVSVITSDPRLLKSEGQVHVASLIDKMLNTLMKSRNLADVQILQLATTNIVAGLGNAMRSSSMNASVASSSDGVTQARKLSQSLMESLKKSFDLLLSSVVMGQNYTEIGTPNLAMLAGIRQLDNLANEPLKLKDSSFSLPSMDVFQSSLSLSKDDPLRVQMSYTSNPFMYSKSASLVDTDVISLSLGTKIGQELKVDSLSTGIHITIENQGEGTRNQSFTVKANEISRHKTFVSTNDSSFHGIIRPINCSVPINVTIQKNEYNYKWMLPRNDSRTDQYSFFLSNVQLNRTAAGSYFIYIQPGNQDQVMENCTGYLNYSMKTFNGACTYWDEVEEIWKGDNCEVMEETTERGVHCLCNHLTSFGGGFFVAPNPINFDTVFQGLSDISNNPAVLAFVSSIFGLYILLVIWARRADLKDAAKTGIIVLPDNDPRDSIAYEITVYTGFNQEAGTTADVYLQLLGSSGDSDPRVLKDPTRPTLQRAGVDRFLFTVPQSLGDLREIHIWHNNTGKSPGWFFFRMQIRDCQTQNKWWFVCNKWLAVDEDDGKVERTIRTATNSDLTQFNVLFVNATRRNLFDGHLWLSVYTRPVQSTFTRVQRLSCCLSVLCCTMLTNAMFFQGGGGISQDTTFSLGPFQFSWSLIMIGVQSSVIIMPVNVLLVTIFRKLAPKENKEKKYEVTSFDQPKVEAEEKTNYEEDEEKDEDSPPKNGLFGFFSKKKSKDPPKKFLFPYWFIYVAYGLCFMSTLVSATFTVFYGIMFGKEKSEQWLSAMVISLFQSIVVIQPAKVLMLATFFALIIKDPNKEEEELDENKTLDDNHTGSLLNDDEVTSLKKALFSKPPAEEKLQQARALRLKEKQMSAIIHEIVLHFLVVILVLFVAFANHDNKSFMFSNQVTHLLTNGNRPFHKITNYDTFWQWAESVLLPNMYPVDSRLGYPYMDIMHNGKRTNIVGVGRLRQLRNKKHTCEVPTVFKVDINECNDEYSWPNEETESFNPRWKPYNDTIVSSPEQHKPWKYRSSWDLKGFPYFGKMGTYRGGGYVVDLGPTNKTVFDNVKTLWKDNWIDPYTRGIFTELNVYNVDINLLCVITLLYEFLPSTGGVYSINIQTIKLFRYLSGLSTAVMGFEIIFLFLTFYWIYRDCKKIVKQRPRQYFKSVWNVVDSVITLLSITATVIYFARLFAISVAINQFHEDRDRFVNFQYVVTLNEVLNALTAFIVLLCTLKFLRLLRFNRKVSMFSDTLRHSANTLFTFVVMIIMIVLVFCFLSNLVFGQTQEEYRTIIRSAVSLFSMMLGDFNYHIMEEGHRIIGPLLFFTFMVSVQFILVNLFIGILCDSFNTVRSDSSRQSNEYEIVDFILGRVKSLVGIVSKPPILPEYKWPKDVLDKQVESINDKSDAIMNYMRTLGDEDLRTSIWIESSNSEKVNQVIRFAVKTNDLNLEDEFFDGVPVLINYVNSTPEKEFTKFIKAGSLMSGIDSRPSESNYTYSERGTSIGESDTLSTVSEEELNEEENEVFTDANSSPTPRPRSAITSIIGKIKESFSGRNSQISDAQGENENNLPKQISTDEGSAVTLGRSSEIGLLFAGSRQSSLEMDAQDEDNMSRKVSIPSSVEDDEGSETASGRGSTISILVGETEERQSDNQSTDVQHEMEDDRSRKVSTDFGFVREGSTTSSGMGSVINILVGEREQRSPEGGGQFNDVQNIIVEDMSGKVSTASGFQKESSEPTTSRSSSLLSVFLNRSKVAPSRSSASSVFDIKEENILSYSINDGENMRKEGPSDSGDLTLDDLRFSDDDKSTFSNRSVP